MSEQHGYQTKGGWSRVAGPDKTLNRTIAGSDEQARFQTASVHQVLPSSMHGGLVCLCGAELPKHRDATEHIIDAYNAARNS